MKSEAAIEASIHALRFLREEQESVENTEMGFFQKQSRLFSIRRMTTTFIEKLEEDDSPYDSSFVETPLPYNKDEEPQPFKLGQTPIRLLEVVEVGSVIGVEEPRLPTREIRARDGLTRQREGGRERVRFSQFTGKITRIDIEDLEGLIEAGYGQPKKPESVVVQALALGLRDCLIGLSHQIPRESYSKIIKLLDYKKQLTSLIWIE